MPGTPHTVSDVMTRTGVAVGRDASFKEIVRPMRRWKAGAMPVLDKEEHVSASSPRPTCCPRRSSATAPRASEQGRSLDDVAKPGV